MKLLFVFVFVLLLLTACTEWLCSGSHSSVCSAYETGRDL